MRVLFFLLLIASTLHASADSREVESPSEFSTICERLGESDNPYFGTARMLSLRNRVKAISGEPSGWTAEEVGLNAQLAHELLRRGSAAEAAGLLEAALESKVSRENPEIRSSLLFSLGLAHMRSAETINCVAMHGSGSCILPVRDESVHAQPEEARAAASSFLEYLESDPEDVQARWLLNIASMVGGEYPAETPDKLRLDLKSMDETRFERWLDRAPDLGVNVGDLAGGAVMDDFDGDGYLDLISSTWDPCGSLKAFRNDGAGGFDDVTNEWKLDRQLGGLNLIHADYDNDGQLDLFVLRGAWLGSDGRIRNSLLRNDIGEGNGFVDTTVSAGLAYPAYPTQTAAWADFDGDGDLDLYVGNEASSTEVFSWSLVQDQGKAFPSQLFRNEGNGKFRDVTRVAGVANGRFTKGVTWGDFDNDGDEDLYVSNLGPNRLYRNEGAGKDGNVTFVDVAEEMGVTEPGVASFATWFFDYDNDGDLDLYVNDYSARVRDVSKAYLERVEDAGGNPVLYRNDVDEKGKRSFTDVSRTLGLNRPLLPMGANFGDLDGDGWLDIVLGTGVPDLEALMPDVVYRNVGGERFEDVTFSIGMGHLQKGHGAAFGDVDNDGDEDLFRQMGGAYPSDGFSNALYENPSTASWLVIRFAGRDSNRFGVGARVSVTVTEGGRPREIHRRVGSGGSFGGGSLQIELGLGTAAVVDRVEIVWPGSGTKDVYENVGANRGWLATEGEARLTPLDLARITRGASE